MSDKLLLPEDSMEASHGTGGVMASVLASSAVDHGIEPRSGQTKDYNTICVWYFSAKHT